VRIASKLLMCPEHWRLCPARLKSEVWRWYRPGQEKRPETVSTAYYDAARKAVEAVNTALLRDDLISRQGLLL
jgi:hypothetical protein